MTRSGSHRLGGNGLGAVSRCFGIAGRLLYAAGSSLSRCGSLLSLLAGSLSARGSLVSAIGGIHCALRRIGRVGAACHQRKG